MARLVVVNPVAGRGRARHVWSRLRDVFGPHVEYVSTLGPGHAREIARAAVSESVERLIVVGGDGTLNEVANGLAGSATALAVVPAGTGNDFARTLGVPGDLVAAARVATLGTPRAIDLGTLDNGAGARYFLNVAGFGFDAEVAWRVNEFPAALKPGARTPYLLGILHALGGYQPACVDLEIGDRRWQQVLFVAAIANGPAYGGGLRVAPRARIDDGLLDVCVIGDISRLDALRLVPRLYRGDHADHPAVSFWRTPELYASAADPLRCHVDGEFAGGLPATFRVAPGALQCVTVP